MGFPSPAADFVEGKLDLNTLCIEHPSATYFVRMSSDDMHALGIHADDILVIDRSVTPTIGDVIMVDVNGVFLCREFGGVTRRGVKIISHGQGKTDIRFEDPDQVEVFGVVSSVVRHLNSGAGGVPRLR
jgi:DNA polymerase V